WATLKPLVSSALKCDEKQTALVPASATSLQPFEIRSLRDFMLSEQHAINAARGFVKYFKPGFLPGVKLFEKVTGKTFPPLKPKPIWYQQPIYYFSNHLNLAGDHQTIEWPSYCRFLDYELELAFVITKPLRNATEQQAREAIGGFMVLNDFSARDVQLQEMRSGFGPQKSKHFVNALSHTVATADSILPVVQSLKAKILINDQQVCSTTTAGMQHSITDILMHASRDETLHPGEVFATGTLPNGCAMENHCWLKPGDTIELKIERIGSLINRIELERS
ncbi:MAG: fumarylacetoacetate hydrolase family protein, partial [Ketobacter sp.]